MSRINNKEPLIRVVKKAEISGFSLALLSVISIVVAFVAGGIFFLMLGINPLSAYAKIFAGAFKGKIAIIATVKIAVPLLITSLGITLAFKMQFWNIGAEGQIIMGAICASYFALFHSDMPHIPLIITMFAAGIIGGGLWGLIPAFFKCKFNTNETLFTLMLNYIALYLIIYFKEGPWRDPSSGGFPKIATFVENARLDKLLGVHIGWVIALVLVAAVYIYLKYTKQGYEISVVGESKNTARYAGMNVDKIVMRTMFLSGAICGIAGMTQATGAAYTLSDGIAGGVGFTAIIVAWLSRLNAVMCIFVTLLLSVLDKGGSVMQSAFSVPTYVSEVLKGIILFVILGFDFFIQYKVVIRKEKKS